jgi:hypothetical protein
MSKQTILVGASANDKTGDTIRNAFIKVNANFAELYAGGASESQLTNGAYTLTLGSNGMLTFPDATTTTGKSITIPTDNSLTVNLSNSSPSANTTFKINPLSIKLQTGNGAIFSGVDGDLTHLWSLDATNKTFYFPDAGDSVYPQIRYSTSGGDGMQLFTSSKPIKITTSARNWSFNTDGSLTLPGYITSQTGLPLNLIASTGSNATLTNASGSKGIFVTQTDVLINNEANTWTFGSNGGLTFPNNSTFTGQTLTDVSGTTNYSLKIANGTTGSVFAVGTGTDAYGVANDALDHTQTTYVPYNATASTMSFNIPGKVGSLTINANGVVTVPNGLVIPTGAKTSTATGTAGQISYDSTYMYICISTNTWRRVALGGTY